MLKDREKLYQAYHAVLSMALTWAFVLVLDQYFLLKVPIVLSAVLSLLPALLINLFILNRKNIISYILLAGIFVLLGLILWIMKLNPLSWMKDFLNWCRVYGGESYLYKSYYADFIIVIAAIVGAVIFYLLMKLEITKICLAIAIVATMVILAVSKADITKAVVGICIFYLLTVVVEFYGILHSRKIGRQDKKEGILYLAPICLMLAALVVLLPSKPEPIQWTFVKSTYKEVKERIEQWQLDWNYHFGNGSAFFSVSGFSEEGSKLEGGKKLSTDTKVALQTSGLGSGSKLYLIGSINETYTGHSWEKNNNNFLKGERDYGLDYLELFYALSRQDETTLERYNFLQKQRIHIIFNNMKTKSVFYPLKTGNIESGPNYEMFEEAPQVSFSHRYGKGTDYSVDYVDLNLEGKAFRQMLREADSFTYTQPQPVSEKKIKLLEQFSINSGFMFDMERMSENYQKLKEREEIIRSVYLQLPKDLPERIRELAYSITDGYDNNYDKLKALEKYLQSYTYTLKTEKVPKGQDFVDYFLFDSKQGYCTFFGTAMAIMGRCIGIPTRYVEGYAAKMNEFTKDNYQIRNDSAHAWAEAYLNGVGWIPFEATAPFNNNRYTKWAEEATNTDEGDKDPSDYYNNPQVTTSPKPINPTTPAQQQDNENNTLVILFAAVIGTFLVTVFLFYQVLSIRYKLEFKKADYSKKMYMEFLRILRLLAKSGYTLGSQETIRMLANRIKDNCDYEQVTFREVADIYMRYRYANASVSEKEYAKVEALREELYLRYKKEKKFYTLWLDEFFFLAGGKRG